LTNRYCSFSLLASLKQAEERAEGLEAKLKISEEDCAKAQADTDYIEELRQRLSKAENALSDKIAEQIS
jgi:septal ring factor EnvC (AmiA/AmiB activator)